MRKILILLMPILLAGCVNDTASYLIDGPSNALTVRREQQYFWKGEVDVSLVATRLPDCQRLHALAGAPKDDMKVELFNAGEGLWNVRLGEQLWQVSTQNCNDLTELQYDPKADMGQPVGSFVVRDGKLVFDPAPAPPAGATASPAADAATDTAAPAPAGQQ
jgi:hypothetical protein